MNSKTLLNSQKNDIFRLIKSSGLNPVNFEWKETKSSRAHTSYAYGEVNPILKYKGTEYYFLINYDKLLYNVEFCPSEKIIVGRVDTITSWDILLNYFIEWLDFLQRELEQPDLWEELFKYRPPPDTFSPDLANEPFNNQELKKISEGIDNIRAYLESEFDLSKEQQENVNEQLDYLVTAAQRQGRKDWYNILIAVVLQTCIYLAASPEQANTIWKLIKSSLKEIIQLLP